MLYAISLFAPHRALLSIDVLNDLFHPLNRLPLLGLGLTRLWSVEV